MSAKLKIIILSTILPVILVIYGIFSQQYDIVLNSLLTILCVIAFAIIHKKFPLFSTGTYCWIIIFILMSVFLGKSLKIYFIIPVWDKILHFLSGFILAPIGKQIYKKLNGDNKNISLMSWFVVTFAIASAGVWEIYEFAIDNILGMASQNGSLTDTMCDMIAGVVSAIISVMVTTKIKIFSSKTNYK